MRQEQRPTVDLLTGFLGSGKTTLLNRLLRDRAFDRTAIIINELGKIAIDHLLVIERTDSTALLEGGCLCCTVVDSLPETLLELCARKDHAQAPAFDRILIETTGLADPTPIVQVVRRSPLLSHFLRAGVVVTTVDAVFGAAQIQEHWEAAAQIAMADRLVLTKLDLVADRSGPFARQLAALNPVAEILTADDVAHDPARLVAKIDQTSAPRPRFMESKHSHDIQSFVIPVNFPVTNAGLAAWSSVIAARFGDKLLRCKGFVRVGDRNIVVQGVRSRFDFEPVPPRVGSCPPALVFIAKGIERGAIAATLDWLRAAEGTQPPSPTEYSV